MEIKKFVIKKNETSYEDRKDCWFKSNNVWHQTVPSNCLLFTLGNNETSLFNENLFVILNSDNYGSTYGKKEHSLAEHNIILSTDYTNVTSHGTSKTTLEVKGYTIASNNHKHDDIELSGGSYSEENFYSLFDRYAVGAYTKDYISANSLLLSSKDISNSNIQKIVESLKYFLFIDATRRGKLNKSGFHSHGGTGSIKVPSLKLDSSYQGASSGSTAYREHTHTVNYNITGFRGYQVPKNYLSMHYNKTINSLYFDELPIGTIMLFIDEYDDYMSNWIPLECSMSYCCNVEDDDYSKNIEALGGVGHGHTAEISTYSLNIISSCDNGGSSSSGPNIIQDHTHNFTLGGSSSVYLEPYGLILKPYIKISNNKPNF